MEPLVSPSTLATPLTLKQAEIMIHFFRTEFSDIRQCLSDKAPTLLLLNVNPKLLSADCYWFRGGVRAQLLRD